MGKKPGKSELEYNTIEGWYKKVIEVSSERKEKESIILNITPKYSLYRP